MERKATVKQILTAFWNATEDYDGDISCRKDRHKDGVTYYRIETEGNDFIAAVHDDNPNVVFYRGLTSYDWHTTDGLDAVEIDGKPYLPPDLFPRPMTVSELADEAGVSVPTVYYHARKLGRLPTVEELHSTRPGRPAGRPSKYN